MASCSVPCETNIIKALTTEGTCVLHHRVPDSFLRFICETAPHAVFDITDYRACVTLSYCYCTLGKWRTLDLA